MLMLNGGGVCMNVHLSSSVVVVVVVVVAS